jgi:hypothetical protein
VIARALMASDDYLYHLAVRMLETYSLEELLEINDLQEAELVALLLEEGLFDPDLEVSVG